jgi:tRNA-dihydrouridine synthase
MTIRILITDDHVTIARTGSTWSYTTAPAADMNTIERAQQMARNLPVVVMEHDVTIEHGHDLFSTLVLGVIIGRASSARITSLPVGGN